MTVMKKFFIGILVLALSCMSAQARKVRGPRGFGFIQKEDGAGKLCLLPW